VSELFGISLNQEKHGRRRLQHVSMVSEPAPPTQSVGIGWEQAYGLSGFEWIDSAAVISLSKKTVNRLCRKAVNEVRNQ
jgi:hypothetical protein